MIQRAQPIVHSKRRTLAGVPAWTLVLAIGPAGVMAQEESSVDDRARYFPQEPLAFVEGPAELTQADKAKIPAEPVVQFERHLLPGWRSLLFRSLSFTAAYLDQPDCIEVKDDPNVEGRAALCDFELETGREFRANPDHHLWRFELTWKPGRVFRSAADLTEAYTAVLKAGQYVHVDMSSDPLKGKSGKEKIDYLRWSWGKRLASGVSITGKTTERARLAEGAVLSTREMRGDGFDESIAIEIDLDRLLVYAGDINSAYLAIEAQQKASKAAFSGGEKTSGLVAKDCAASGSRALYKCLGTLSDETVSPRWLAGLLPTFKYEEKDQFDFIRDGGTFFSSALREGSLSTFSLVWDLTSLDTAKHRRAALTAIAKHRELVATDTNPPCKKVEPPCAED